MKYGMIGAIAITCAILFGFSAGAAVIKVKENKAASAAAGVVTFSMPVPGGASGKFEIDIADDTGVSRANQQFIAGVSRSVSMEVAGNEPEVLSVVLTRNGQTAVVGTYLFDFRNRSSTKVKEDITGAFVQVGALEAPADAPAPEQFGDILPSIAKHNTLCFAGCAATAKAT